jgi:hypothetical protein
MADAVEKMVESKLSSVKPNLQSAGVDGDIWRPNGIKNNLAKTLAEFLRGAWRNIVSIVPISHARDSLLLEIASFTPDAIPASRFVERLTQTSLVVQRVAFEDYFDPWTKTIITAGVRFDTSEKKVVNTWKDGYMYLLAGFGISTQIAPQGQYGGASDEIGPNDGLSRIMGKLKSWAEALPAMSQGGFSVDNAGLQTLGVVIQRERIYFAEQVAAATQRGAARILSIVHCDTEEYADSAYKELRTLANGIEDDGMLALVRRTATTIHTLQTEKANTDRTCQIKDQQLQLSQQQHRTDMYNKEQQLQQQLQQYQQQCQADISAKEQQLQVSQQQCQADISAKEQQLQVSQQQNQQLQQNATRLQSEHRSELDRLRQEYRTVVSAEQTKLKQTQQQLQKAIDDRRAAEVKLAQALADKQLELQRAEFNAKQVESKYQTDKRAYETNIQTLQNDRTAVQSLLDQARASLESLQKQTQDAAGNQNAQIMALQDSYKRNMQTYQAQINSLNSRISELTEASLKSETELQAAKSRVAALQLEVDRLESELQTATTEKDNAIQELQEYNNYVVAFVDYCANIMEKGKQSDEAINEAVVAFTPLVQHGMDVKKLLGLIKLINSTVVFVDENGQAVVRLKTGSLPVTMIRKPEEIDWKQVFRGQQVQLAVAPAPAPSPGDPSAVPFSYPVPPPGPPSGGFDATDAILTCYRFWQWTDQPPLGLDETISGYVEEVDKVFGRIIDAVRQHEEPDADDIKLSSGMITIWRDELEKDLKAFKRVPYNMARKQLVDSKESLTYPSMGTLMSQMTRTNWYKTTFGTDFAPTVPESMRYRICQIIRSFSYAVKRSVEIPCLLPLRGESFFTRAMKDRFRSINLLPLKFTDRLFKQLGITTVYAFVTPQSFYDFFPVDLVESIVLVDNEDIKNDALIKTYAKIVTFTLFILVRTDGRSTASLTRFGTCINVFVIRYSDDLREIEAQMAYFSRLCRFLPDALKDFKFYSRDFQNTLPSINGFLDWVVKLNKKYVDLSIERYKGLNTDAAYQRIDLTDLLGDRPDPNNPATTQVLKNL